MSHAVPGTAAEPQIMFRNESSSVFLFDIPTSIASAQNLDGTVNRHIISSKPQNEPFVIQEPKSEKARLKTQLQGDRSGLHHTYSLAIEEALEQIRSGSLHVWCHPRRLDTRTNPRKRKSDWDEPQDQSLHELSEQTTRSKTKSNVPMVEQHDVGGLTAHSHSNKNSEDNVSQASVSSSTRHTDMLGGEATFRSEDGKYEAGCMVSTSRGKMFINQTDAILLVSLCLPASGVEGQLARRLLIPPFATGILASCDDARVLNDALAQSSNRTVPDQRTFDIVLLDPPWPNRSARRKKSYSTEHTMQDSWELLHGLDLRKHIGAHGYVAVWITNRRAVRELVLGSGPDAMGGWFESLGITLVEEWIWIKTTERGQCISDLGSDWRRPYEVLLIGKNQRLDMRESQGQPVKRRVIAGVPDLHSRKPCLKSLFGELLFGGEDYRALEVFARYMVAGWWSWGNEVVKFNHEDSWTSDRQD